jgi:FkbM family methyltransferase
MALALAAAFWCALPGGLNSPLKNRYGTTVALIFAGMVCLQTERAPVSGTLACPREASTTSWLQRALLAVYAAFSRTGLLSTRLGRSVFVAAYDLYKSRWEAAEIAALRSFVRPGTVAIDVGANIGFFTRRLAEWVRPGGLVIAIEPEAQNFEALKAMLSRRGLLNVEVLQAVAAEAAGTLKLEVNAFHPADHRISENGTAVRAVTLDGLMEEQGWPEVSLVKIDVQGAEERVLRGALEVIRCSHPVIFMEVDEAALVQMGSSAQTLLRLVGGLGYEVCRLEKGRLTARLPVEHVVSMCRAGTYADFIFVPRR